MILIGFTSQPPESSKEIVKRMLEIPRLPDYIKGKGSYSYPSKEGGIEGIQIYEFDGSKAEEAINAIMESYWPFINIPRYRYEFRVAQKAREVGKRLLEVG